MRIARIAALAAVAAASVSQTATANTFPISTKWQIKGLQRKDIFQSDGDGLNAKFQVCVDKTVLSPLRVEVSKFVRGGAGKDYITLRAGQCSSGLTDTFKTGDGIVLRLALVIGRAPRAVRSLDFAKGTFELNAAPTPPKPDSGAETKPPPSKDRDCPQAVKERNGGSCGTR